MNPVCSIEIERLGASVCNRIAVPIKHDPLKAAAPALPGADKTANMGMIRAGPPEPDPAPNPGGTKVRIAGRVITLTVTFRRLQSVFSGPRPTVLAWMFAAAMLVAPAASAQAPSSDVASAVATKRLFQAVYDNDLRVVQSSVAIGADIAARDRHGLTPSDIAVDKGFFDIAHFLLSVRNLRLDQNAEPETAAARARRTKSGSVQPLATPAAPAREPAPLTARAVNPRPPARVPVGEETIIRPAGAAPPSAAHDPFDPEIAPVGAVLPVIGPVRRPGSPATASASAAAGPGLDETRPPSRAMPTDIAEIPPEPAERPAPTAQEPSDPAPSPAAKKGFFRRLVDRLVPGKAEPEAGTPPAAASSPATPSVSDAAPEISEPPPVPPVDVAPSTTSLPATAAIEPVPARAVKPRPPAPVSAGDETVFRPAGEASPSTARDSFDREVAPVGAVLPIIGPVRGPESPATASTPAVAGRGLDEIRPPPRALPTEIAEIPPEPAERPGPTAQEPSDPAPSPAAERGFFRRFFDRLVPGEAGSGTGTPPDAAPSPATPSVSDAAPEDSEPAPPTPPVDVAPLPALEPETAVIPPVPALQPGLPADESTPTITRAEAPPAVNTVEATPVPALEPETAAISPTLALQSGPPGDEPTPTIARAEAPPATRAMVGVPVPEPVDPAPSPAAEKGFFRRIFDRLVPGDAGSEAGTPPDTTPSPAPASVSDAAPEDSEPVSPTPPVDVAPLPALEPETAVIPPVPALPSGPPPDESVPAPALAEAPLEKPTTSPSTVPESPPSETAPPSEFIETASAADPFDPFDPFDPNEAPPGAELPIISGTPVPGTTAEAVPPPPLPIAPPAPTTAIASAPPSPPVARPDVSASAAPSLAEAATGTDTAAGPTIDAAKPETPRASAPVKGIGEEEPRPGPLGRLYEAVEGLFGASTEPEERPEPRQATIETASLTKERDEATDAEPGEPPERYLKGVPLTIADDLGIGARKFPQTPVARAPENCVRKQRGTILFCVEPVTWPGDIEEHFAVSTFIYRGTSAIVRYDEGESRYIYALFSTDGFEAVGAHFEARYGPPTSTVHRRVTLMAAPRMTSPTMIWKSVDATSGVVTTLEVRKYDDSRGGFADVRHGALLLRSDGTEPIFPRLSTLELMVLR